MRSACRHSMLVATILFFLLPIATALADNVRLTTDPAEDTAPCVDVDSSGQVRVAWSRDVMGHKQIMWATYSRFGEVLFGPVQVTDSTSDSGSPNISLDGQDRSFLVWQEGAGTSAKTWFARIEADGTVGVVAHQVNTGSGYDWYPDIATTVVGVSHVAVQHTYNTLWYMTYRKLDENGDVVCGATPGDFCIFPIDKYVSVDFDPSGYAVMTWSDYDWFEEGLYVAEYDGDCNRTYRNLLRNEGDITWSSIVPLGHRYWHITYQRRLSGVERILQYTGGADPAISPLPGPSSRVRSAGAAGESIYAVWVDGATPPDRIAGAQWDAAGNLVEDDLEISTSTAAATLPAIGTNGRGQYAVVWRDARNPEGAGEIYLELLPPIGLDVTVLSEKTENPLTEASVTLFRRGIKQGDDSTDADGLCRFSGLEPGEYTAQASFGGHISDLVAGVVPTNGFGAVEVHVATDIELTGQLFDAAPITTGPDASPLVVRDASVVLMHEGAPVDTTSSSSLGRYLFNVTEPGDYYCHAGKFGFPKPGEPADTLYAYRSTTPETVPESAIEVAMPDLALESKVVVMVHGWNSRGRVWDDSGFVERLQQRGWTVVWDFNLPRQLPIVGTWGWAGVEQQAGFLAGTVTDRLATSSFHIVAHSQGGLVSRFLIEQMRRNEEPRVNKCITLATPHHGSPVAGDAVFLIEFIASRFLPPIYNLILHQLLEYFQDEYPAVRDLDANSQFLRTLNRGTQDHGDWSGWCLFDVDVPEPEILLNPQTTYAVLAGTGEGDEWWFQAGDLLLNARGCATNDGIVPATSAHLYGDGNVHNWLASDFGIDVHHKRFDRAVGIVESPQVQELVAGWLASDPSAWPPSHASPVPRDGVPGAWTRMGLLQIAAMPGEVAEEGVTIDTCDTLRINWAWFDGSVDLALVTPLGAVVDSATAAVTPGIEYVRDPSNYYGYYLITGPDVGDWTLRVQDVAASAEQNVLLWLEGAAALRLDLRVTPDTPAIYSDHTVAAALTDAVGHPLLGATAIASVFHPSQTSVDLPLLDDGLPPDAVADDGVYSGTLVLETTPGTTVVDVTASGAAPEVFSRRAVTGLGRGPVTDAGIVDPGLTVHDFNGLAGCRMTLRGTVINYGPLDASLAVEVVAENEMIVLQADTLVVPVGGTIEVETSHLPLAVGQYRYRLRISPVGDVGEFDWADNVSVLTVDVGSPVTTVPGGGSANDKPEIATLLQGRAARLLMAYPNPFNPVVTLRCAIAAPGPIRICAYDIRGRKVWSQETGVLPAGVHEIHWLGTDGFGRAVASGLYLLRLDAAGVNDVRKVMLVR